MQDQCGKESIAAELKLICLSEGIPESRACVKFETEYFWGECDPMERSKEKGYQAEKEEKPIQGGVSTHGHCHGEMIC